MSKIDIKNLVKYFGPQKILHGIDISISKGEFCVLVGPSMCVESIVCVGGWTHVAAAQRAIQAKYSNPAARLAARNALPNQH